MPEIAPIQPHSLEELVAERLTGLQNFGSLSPEAQSAVSDSLLKISHAQLTQAQKEKQDLMAALNNPVPELMDEERKRLKEAFGGTDNNKSLSQIVSKKNVESVVKAFEVGLTIKEVETLQERAKRIRPEQIRRGREFHSGEVQPPNTRKTGLHKGK